EKHQPYLYNVALRLFLDPDDAKDATQEVLIKIITRIGSFGQRSQFRTWAYRIMVNHYLHIPPRKRERQLLPDTLPAPAQVADHPPEISEEEIEEVRLLCATGMLMCLDRRQRLIYIIGEVFEADHQLGAELFDTTPGNFRVLLSRARKDLSAFVAGKCGLIRPENPCRCPKKTRELVSRGIVEKEHLRFNTSYSLKVKDMLAQKKNEVSDRLQLEVRDLFQDSPFQVLALTAGMMDEVLEGIDS
ncbi:MAG: RNA polymerase sigma factor, partial [Bacteroidetes bacterium]